MNRINTSPYTIEFTREVLITPAVSNPPLARVAKALNNWAGELMCVLKMMKRHHWQLELAGVFIVRIDTKPSRNIRKDIC
ncbi:hypothetical protein J6590_047071 [Homalodisca vitripennis]|nr:hypothetical protein J6590_047071 [Homalodisca vitripennis]